MGLFDTLQSWWSRDAPLYVVADLPSTAVDPPAGVGEPCEAGVHYFRIWLAEMRLAKDREWFASRHPVVHSLVRFTFGNDQVDLPRIAGPLNLKGLDAAHLGDTVQLNYPLTTLLPFNGGVVELSAGLLALEGRNVLREFVTAVERFTQVLAAPPLAGALAVIGPATSAIQGLLSSSNGQLHLGLHLGFAGNGAHGALHEGYIAVVRGTAAQVDAQRLGVTQGTLRYNGTPLSGLDYMLFRIERRKERDDWDSLGSIAAPYKDALRALSQRDAAAADAFVRKAILEAFTSPDLTRVDRTRVASEIKRGFQEARDAGFGLEAAPRAGALTAAMQGAPDVERFRQQAPPRLDELLALG